MTSCTTDKRALQQDQGFALETVVLLHCSASSSRQWRSLLQGLGNGFEALAIDLYGHGNCMTWRGKGPLTLEAEGAAISAAVGDRRTPFHLIGHSYGGGVALRFALQNCDRIRSLTLIEPSCFHLLRDAADDADLLDEIRSVAEGVNRAVLCGDYHTGMEGFLDYWSGKGTWKRLSEEEKAALAAKAVHISHHFFGLIEDDNPIAAYGAITAPALIVCGTHSPRPSRAITRLLAETLPNARHRTIRGAGHMSPMTHRHITDPLILEHLHRGSAPPASTDVSIAGGPAGPFGAGPIRLRPTPCQVPRHGD